MSKYICERCGDKFRTGLVLRKYSMLPTFHKSTTLCADCESSIICEKAQKERTVEYQERQTRIIKYDVNHKEDEQE